MRAALPLLLLFTAGGCGTAGLLLEGAPAAPFDAAIVPGCPSEDDGSLSLCQLERVLWSTLLYERGWVKAFIVSGGAVHSPYVEAEALAAGMAAAGVPADRIYLEPNARHTDENMYFSLLVARAAGLRTIAVASQPSPAVLSCRMLLDWGQPCRALGADRAQVIARHAASREALARVRARPVDGWVPLAEQERRVARATGRSPRPPSYFLYPTLGLLRASGHPWTPEAPERAVVERWSDHLRRKLPPPGPPPRPFVPDPCDGPKGLCF